MIFLILPAVALWRDDRSAFWRVGGILLILLFAVSYSVGAWQILEKGRGGTRAPLLFLGFLIALTLLAIPFLGIETGSVDDRVLPESASSRAALDDLRSNFSGRETSAITIVLPEGAERDSIYVDLWDDYLDPA